MQRLLNIKLTALDVFLTNRSTGRILSYYTSEYTQDIIRAHLIDVLAWSGYLQHFLLYVVAYADFYTPVLYYMFWTWSRRSLFQMYGFYKCVYQT